MDQSFSCLAQTVCAAQGWEFDDVFRYQYRITKADSATPVLSKRWKSLSFADLRVEYCPSLAMSKITDETGALIAVVLGVAVAPNGRCVAADMTCAFDGPALEQWIEQLAGRFVVLANCGGHVRFYVDPASNLSAVCNKAEKTIGSSVPLVINGPLLMHEQIDHAKVLAKKERFAFGDTVDRRVRRLQPNHYLDMETFASHRHWPHSDTPFADLDQNRRDCIEEIGDRLSASIDALVSTYDCALPVTAGQDSRILLAAATPNLDKVKEFYCYHLNRSTYVDAVGAVRLAEQVGVPMRIISRRSPLVQNSLPASFDEEEYQKMLLRTGWCYGMRKDWGRYVALSPPVDVVLRGTGLEMARANKWSEKSISAPCSSVNGLATLTGLRAGKRRTEDENKRYAYLLDKYQGWMDGLPSQAHARLYDLAHVELMLPAGPVLEYSAYVRHFSVNPFNDRRLYQLTSAIAPRARMRGSVVRKLISAKNRSLLRIPFHRELAGQIGGQKEP